LEKRASLKRALQKCVGRSRGRHEHMFPTRSSCRATSPTPTARRLRGLRVSKRTISCASPRRHPW
jgi:hypothetical protein